MRDLWLSRDELAQSLDISPGRLLTDAAISTLALASDSSPLTTRKQLEKVLRPIGLRARWFEHSDRWIAAIAAALATPESQWPPMRVKSDALPPIKLWRDKFPERFTPYSHARFHLTELALSMEMPVENLLTPEIGRRICWNLGGQSATQSEIEVALQELGARPWQVEATASIFEAALREVEPLEVVEPAQDPEDSSESS
jgi:ribonuclease D